MKDKLIGIKEAAELLGVSDKTLRNWDNSGKFVAVKTEGGHRRYKLSDIYKYQGKSFDSEDNSGDITCVCCRVSNNKQINRLKFVLDIIKNQKENNAIVKKIKANRETIKIMLNETCKDREGFEKQRADHLYYLSEYDKIVIKGIDCIVDYNIANDEFVFEILYRPEFKKIKHIKCEDEIR